MANLLRTAKSGSDWTRAELDAYNIAIVPQTKAEFFGPLPNRLEILRCLEAFKRFVGN